MSRHLRFCLIRGFCPGCPTSSSTSAGEDDAANAYAGGGAAELLSYGGANGTSSRPGAYAGGPT